MALVAIFLHHHQTLRSGAQHEAVNNIKTGDLLQMKDYKKITFFIKSFVFIIIFFSSVIALVCLDSLLSPRHGLMRFITFCKQNHLPYAHEFLWYFNFVSDWMTAIAALIATVSMLCFQKNGLKQILKHCYLYDQNKMKHILNGLLWGIGLSAISFIGIFLINFFYGNLNKEVLNYLFSLKIEQHIIKYIALIIAEFLACMCIALCEEFAFRGYLLKIITKGFGFWPAVVVTSLLFTFMHVWKYEAITIIQPRSPHILDFVLCLLIVFVSAIILCLGVRRTGSLWWPIGCHLGYDFIDVIYGYGKIGSIYSKSLPASGGVVYIHSMAPDIICLSVLIVACIFFLENL